MSGDGSATSSTPYAYNNVREYDYDPLWPVEFVQSFYRGGKTTDFANLVSPSSSTTRWNYIVGVTITAQIGVLLLFLWTTALLLYQYLHKSASNDDTIRNENKKPWLAGYPLPPCVHPQEARVRIFVPERRYTGTPTTTHSSSSSSSTTASSPKSGIHSVPSSGILSRSSDSNIEVELKPNPVAPDGSLTTARIVRSLILVSCVGIGASSVALMIKGLYDVQLGLSDFDSYVESYVAYNVEHGTNEPTIAATESLLNYLHLIKGLESPYCPAVTTVLSNDTLPVITNTLRQVHDFLLYAQDGAVQYYSTPILYKWINTQKIISLVVCVIVGINMTSVGIMMHTASAWKGRILCSHNLSHCRGNRKRVSLLLSVFALCLLGCLCLGVFSLVAATSLSDFCIAPRKSIHTLLDIDYVTEWSSSTDGYELTHDAVDYYTHPCATIANQNGTENAYYSSFYHPLSQASAELDQTTDAIISYCARNFSYAVYELRDDLSIIEDNLACTYVHPIYRDMVYNAICDDLMSGLTWSFISLAILMLCGGCILTLRAGVSIRDDVGIMITEEIMRSRSS